MHRYQHNPTPGPTLQHHTRGRHGDTLQSFATIVILVIPEEKYKSETLSIKISTHISCVGVDM